MNTNNLIGLTLISIIILANIILCVKASPLNIARPTNWANTITGNFTITEYVLPQYIQSSYLLNCNTIDTDANGFMTCGTDEGGAGGEPLPEQIAYENETNTYTQEQVYTNYINATNQTIRLAQGNITFGDAETTYISASTANMPNRLVISAGTQAIAFTAGEILLGTNPQFELWSTTANTLSILNQDTAVGGDAILFVQNHTYIGNELQANGTITGNHINSSDWSNVTIDTAQIIDLTNITLTNAGVGDYITSLTLASGLLTATYSTPEVFVYEEYGHIAIDGNVLLDALIQEDTLTIWNGTNIRISQEDTNEINISVTPNPKFVTLNLTDIGITNNIPNELNITTDKGRIDIDVDGNIRFINGELEMCQDSETCNIYSTQQGVRVPSGQSAFIALANNVSGLYFQASGLRGYNFTGTNGETAYMMNIQTYNLTVPAGNGTWAACGPVNSGDELIWACAPKGSSG